MMYYRDIPEDLRKVLPTEGITEGFFADRIRLRSAFTWAWTNQGHKFWLLVEQGRFDEARKMTINPKKIELVW